MHSQFLNIVFAEIHNRDLSKSDFQLLCVLPGSIFFIVGIVMKYFTPKYPNLWFGYRTPFSVKNEQTWNEANSYAANIAIVVGVLNAVVWGYLGYKFSDDPNNQIVGSIGAPIIIISAAMLLILTEIHLRKIFDKDGKRREGNNGQPM